MSRIVLIGAGNLATHLGLALKDAGHDVIQVFSRTMSSASELAEKLQCPATNELEQVARHADIYILSVKDSALATLIPALCPSRPQALFIHTAGSMPMNLFQGFAQHYGVLYPMQTFSKQKPLVFRTIPTFIEANSQQSLAQIQTLAESLTDTVYQLSTEQRAHLHLAAVFAFNFVNHCYHLAAQVLEKQGVPFSVMLSLIDETAQKVHQLHPRQAQTGPAIRNDQNVIANHLALLKDDPALQQLYLILSDHIQQTAESHD